MSLTDIVKKTIAPAVMVGAVGLYSADAEAIKPKPEATLTPGTVMCKKGEKIKIKNKDTGKFVWAKCPASIYNAGKRRKKRIRVPACGVRRDLRDYKCLTESQAEKMSLDTSAGMSWSDYKYKNQDTGRKIGLFTPGRVYVGCPGPSGTSREKKCYDVTEVKPKVVKVPGPERVVTKTVPGPERVVEKVKVVKVPVPGKDTTIEKHHYHPASQPTCSRRTASACQDENSCLEAKCNWYDGKCHTEAKPEVPTPTTPRKNWEVSGIAGASVGDGAQGYVGVDAKRRVIGGLKMGVRAGYIGGDIGHPSTDVDRTTESEILPDGTTYKTIDETVTNNEVNNTSRFFAGPNARYDVVDNDSWSLGVAAGVDARVSSRESEKDYSKTVGLQRNDQNLRDPKTITNKESSSKLEVGAFPYGGIEACKKVGGAKLCITTEAGYDTKTEKGNVNFGFKGGYEW